MEYVTPLPAKNVTLTYRQIVIEKLWNKIQNHPGICTCSDCKEYDNLTVVAAEDEMEHRGLL